MCTFSGMYEAFEYHKPISKVLEVALSSIAVFSNIYLLFAIYIIKTSKAKIHTVFRRFIYAILFSSAAVTNYLAFLLRPYAIPPFRIIYNTGPLRQTGISTGQMLPAAMGLSVLFVYSSLYCGIFYLRTICSTYKMEWSAKVERVCWAVTAVNGVIFIGLMFTGLDINQKEAAAEVMQCDPRLSVVIEEYSGYVFTTMLKWSTPLILIATGLCLQLLVSVVALPILIYKVFITVRKSWCLLSASTIKQLKSIVASLVATILVYVIFSGWPSTLLGLWINYDMDLRYAPVACYIVTSYVLLCPAYITTFLIFIKSFRETLKMKLLCRRPMRPRINTLSVISKSTSL